MDSIRDPTKDSTKEPSFSQVGQGSDANQPTPYTVNVTSVTSNVPPGALALAIPANSPPAKLRIGAAKYKYDYTLVPGPIPVYKCRRGSDKAPEGAKLWLLQRTHDEWVAFDAADDSLDDGTIPPIGQVIFRSFEDILIQGWHKWCMEMSDGREGSFETTWL